MKKGPPKHSMLSALAHLSQSSDVEIRNMNKKTLRAISLVVASPLTLRRLKYSCPFFFRTQ